MKSVLQTNVLIQGDGTATSIVVDLSLPPYNLDLKGNRLVGVEFPSSEATGSVDGTRLTVEPNSLVANGDIVSIAINLLFDGE